MDSLISTGVAGQRRTSPNKQFVVYKNETPSVVYKGPYRTDGSDKRYNSLYARYTTLSHWKTPNIALPLGLQTFASLQRNDGKGPVTTVIFPNLLGRYPNAFESYEEKTGLVYCVSKDTGLQKLNRVLPQRSDLLTKDLLLALLELFVLKTGDMNTSNILTNGNQVFVIDIEDTLGKPYLDDPIFFFNKAPAAKHKVFESWGKWYSEMIPLIRDLDLSKIPVSLLSAEEAKSRQELAISLLQKYTYNGEAAIQSAIQSGPIFVISTKASTTASSVIPVANGNMVYKGMRAGSITFHGYSPSLIKSALQKNIRRGNVAQSLFCGFEMYAFIRVEGMPLVHNMYNRLSVIACEDISPFDLSLAAYVSGWVSKWVQGSESKWAFPVEGKYHPSRLAAVIQTLASAPKSRMASHLWNAYTRKEGLALLAARGINVDFSEAAPQAPFLLPEDLLLEQGQLAYHISKIYQLLGQKNHQAVFWIGSYLEKYSKLKVKKRLGRTKSEILLWVTLGQFFPEEHIAPLREAYFFFSETRPFLMCVVTSILVGGVVSPLSDTVAQINYLTRQWEKQPSLQSLLTNSYALTIQPYMRDKHTGVSGDPAVLRKLFVTEGAKVENQDPRVLDPMLKEIYEAL